MQENKSVQIRRPFSPETNQPAGIMEESPNWNKKQVRLIVCMCDVISHVNPN